MASLCDYSNAFGAPGKGAHAPRLLGVAAVDLLLTALAAVILTRSFVRNAGLAVYMLVFVVLMAAAVGAHELFCVNTRLNAALFGRAWPDPDSASAAA